MFRRGLTTGVMVFVLSAVCLGANAWETTPFTGWSNETLQALLADSPWAGYATVSRQRNASTDARAGAFGRRLVGRGVLIVCMGGKRIRKRSSVVWDRRASRGLNVSVERRFSSGCPRRFFYSKRKWRPVVRCPPCLRKPDAKSCLLGWRRPVASRHNAAVPA